MFSLLRIVKCVDLAASLSYAGKSVFDRLLANNAERALWMKKACGGPYLSLSLSHQPLNPRPFLLQISHKKRRNVRSLGISRIASHAQAL